MKNGPEAFALAMSTMPFFLLLFVVFGHSTDFAWRVIASITLIPAAGLWFYFGRRYWAAWKAYQAEFADIREGRSDDYPNREDG